MIHAATSTHTSTAQTATLATTSVTGSVSIAAFILALVLWFYAKKHHHWVPWLMLIALMGAGTSIISAVGGMVSPITGAVGGLGALICGFILYHDWKRKHASPLTFAAIICLPFMATGIVLDILNALAHVANSGGAIAGKAG
jgi:hypothetical protein